MSIVYALVARSPDIVLTEFTDFAGNFEQNTRLLLKNLRKVSKSTIVFNKYILIKLDMNSIIFMNVK